MSERVHEFASQLRQYATHFEKRDWNYTRKTNIKHIRRVGDWSGYDHPVRRLVRVVKGFGPRREWEKQIGWNAWRHPLVHIRVGMATESHSPDGVLDGGCIITSWEETGEYLQYVQPSVGALLADLMDAHPELPEVQAIADEMKRINDRYGERIDAGDVA